MKLTAKQGYALLDTHGCYITEICDRCGKGIGRCASRARTIREFVAAWNAATV